MRSIYLYLEMFYELLPDNFRNSKQRLSSLFNKLKKQSEKLKEYHGIISSQIAENIIEVAGNTPVPGRCHYLSHHPVYKEAVLLLKPEYMTPHPNKKVHLLLIVLKVTQIYYHSY